MSTLRGLPNSISFMSTNLAPAGAELVVGSHPCVPRGGFIPQQHGPGVGESPHC
jgi:hypothetical protein